MNSRFGPAFPGAHDGSRRVLTTDPVDRFGEGGEHLARYPRV